MTTTSNITYKNYIKEIESLKSQISYSMSCIEEATESWVKKEYAQVVEMAKERLALIEGLVSNKSLWA